MVVFSMLAGILGTIVVFSDPGNTLGSLARIISLLCFMIGLFGGTQALKAFIVVIAYVDLVKRVLVLYGNFNYLDIASVLASAPLMLLGICMNIFFGAFIFRTRSISKVEAWTFMVCVAMTVTSALYALVAADGSIFATLKNLAFNSAYYMVPWVVVVALTTIEAVRDLLKFIIIVFLPVALYGIWQGVFGLQNFEIEYLLSGYTLEVRQLKNEIMRIPSTMNSARSLSVAMAFVICLILTLKRTRDGGFLGWLSPMVLGVVSVYAICLIFTLTRAGWVVALACPLLGFCFADKRRTVAFYSITILAFVLMVANARLILESWGDIAKSVADFVDADSSFVDQATRVGTFSARIVGWYNLTTNPELWTLFGRGELAKGEFGSIGLNTGLRLDQADAGLTHDALSSFIVTYGIVPALIIVMVVTSGLVKVHRMIFRFNPGTDRRLIEMLVATVAAVGLSGLTQFFHAPVNVFLGLASGALVATVHASRLKESAQFPIVRSSEHADANLVA